MTQLPSAYLDHDLQHLVLRSDRRDDIAIWEHLVSPVEDSWSAAPVAPLVESPHWLYRSMLLMPQRYIFSLPVHFRAAVEKRFGLRGR